VAAAVCGVLAQQSDPALPPNGAELGGLGEIGGSFSDGELTLLLKGGVTAVESVGGVISVIRGVTTRTTTAGVADTTWREVTTIMIVDRVIPQIRDSLRTKFARAKNNAQTRGAIRTQVIIQLEDMVEREFIDSYGDVSVQPDSQDPTVCLVSFSFAVAHALNRIELRASITV
jgi:phage tail sheath gpL-like